MDGDNADFWQYIEPKIDPDPFFTKFHISSMNKGTSYKTPLKTKGDFNWF